MTVGKNYQFYSLDRTFGLTVPISGMEVILGHCIGSEDRETGGIIIGYYSRGHDMAVVTRVSGPPEDSIQKKTWFSRGVHGLQRLLNALWASGEFYLGEWHYHPSSEPVPSGIDDHQMEVFSQNSLLSCPEPILLIIGGNPRAKWTSSAIVYRRNKERIEMPLRSYPNQMIKEQES